MSDPSETTPYQPPPTSPAERFAAGELLAGRYRVVAPLGKGGMGEVYRADDLTLGQPVALKFLPQHIAHDPDRLSRFKREVAAARKVSHPNVCRVYDIADQEPQPFLTMEFVDGEDLAGLLTRVGRLPEEKGVEIARQLCGALAAVHDQGLLHRDLKPANVMLDGRGKVRLTDFGLAAAAQDLTAGDVRSGTPLYQAPEQLAGKEVTVRSDLYALGLVLYELLTGRRAFADTSRDVPPSKPSSHVTGLDPAVERVVLQCLDPNPAARPRSAAEVLAGLPGGEPPAAARAAGVTPSPQMVADAGQAGLISPWVGSALLAALALTLVAFAALYPQVMAFTRVGGLPRSTDWLAAKARDVRELASYPDGKAAVPGYDFDMNLFRWIERTDTSADRWDRLNDPPNVPMVFWYRESPAPLLPGLFYPYSGSVETTRVTWTDPAPLVPGMTGVRLAPDGRLVEFYAVSSAAAEPDAEPDWSAWFKKAHLDLVAFRPATEHPWTAPVFADRVLTWVPADPADPTRPARVEAGTFRQRVVWFRITPAWQLTGPSGEPSKSSAAAYTSQGIGDQGSAVGGARIYIPLVVAILILAPITLRSGRADRTGAFRLAAGVFVLVMLVWGFETTHVFGYDEVQLFVLGVSGALYWAAITGFAYLVLEPYVRRWWPETVISWNRLLVGRWRDPLVGRDVLVGTLSGALWVVCGLLANQVPRWVGQPAPMPWWDWWVPNTRVPGQWAGNFLMNFAYSFRFAFFYCLLLLLLLRVLFRRQWLAGVAFVVVTAYTVADDFGFSSPSLGWPLIVAGQVLFLITLVRFGALAMMVAYFVMNTLWFPMTTDPARDYFASGLLALGAVVGPAVFGLYTATGGRVFGKGGGRDD